MSDQCSGPFTDARDCPMHAKDVPTPLYTQAQMDAEVERATKPLREALEIIEKRGHEYGCGANGIVLCNCPYRLAARALGRER